MAQRVQGRRCQCGGEALSTGRCRSCAAKLANETRRRNEIALAKAEIEDVLEEIGETRRVLEAHITDLQGIVEDLSTDLFERLKAAQEKL